MAIQMPPAPDVTQRVARLERELQALGGVALRERGWRSDHVGGRAVDPRFASRSDILREAGDFDLTAAWVPEHDYAPEEDRSVIRALRGSPGVTSWNDFIVTATQPASWAVDVGPGRAIIDGSVSPWTQGSYIAYRNSSKRVEIQPAHPTLDRYDVVGIHIYDQANSTEEGFGGATEVITGVPGAGDMPPDLPPNFLPLKGLKIAAGDTAVLPTSGWPPVWGQTPETYGDLRRPVTTPLYEQLDRKRMTLAANSTTAMAWFAWIGSPAWRPVALWPFPVVMQVILTAYGSATGAATATQWRLYPRTGTAEGGAPMYTRAIQSANNIHYTDQEFQLFDPAQQEAPAWFLQVVVGATGSVIVDLQCSTTIWPYTTNMRRLTHQDQGGANFPNLNFPT